MCDAANNDCDGDIDEGTECADDDGDGYCEDPVSCTDGALPGDCNDSVRWIAPGLEMVEVVSMYSTSRTNPSRVPRAMLPPHLAGRYSDEVNDDDKHTHKPKKG